MKLYKLTDQNNMTNGNTTWSEGFELILSKKKNPRLCSSDVVHGYKNLNLGLLLNPSHGNYIPPKAWEAEGDICVEDWGKVGCFSLKTTKEISLPEWFLSDKKMDVIVLFLILCAESVLEYFEKKYPKDDRPRAAIDAAKKYLKLKTQPAARAARAAADAARAAAYSADVAYAARAAAYAAYAAGDAAYASAYAADVASDAAYAAYSAADAAAYAAYADAVRAVIDFSSLADTAIKTIMRGVK